MRACTTAGGAVMFIPDQLENASAAKKNKSVSYKDLAGAPISALERLEQFAKKVAGLRKVA